MGACLGGVFAVSDVADVVQFVFDAPVFACVGGDLRGICASGVYAGDPEDRDGTGPPGLGGGDVAFDEKHLCGMRKIDVVWCRLNSDRAAFGTAMPNSFVGV